MHAGRNVTKTVVNAAKNTNTGKEEVSNKDLQRLINEKFDSLTALVQQLQNENLQLSNQVHELEDNVEKLSSENNTLKSVVNKQFLAHDALNQYGRHKNERFINIAEPVLARGEKEDCMKPIIELAKKMHITLSKDDIERCHRLGKPRTNGTSRPIIVRFSSFRKKREMVEKKKSLRIPEEEMVGLTPEEKKAKLSANPFIVEDLTPFRGHIFKYIREWNFKSKKFDVVTTDYGQIVVKEKNADTWHRISSTEDFLNADIPFDAEEFDELL